MKTVLKLSILIFCVCGGARTGLAQAYAQPIFHSSDTLAPRDNWGFRHQMAEVNPTDFAGRYHFRPLYWLEGGNDLMRQPAYVAALQRDLINRGYFCGPIDGIFSAELSDAIARMQKNYSMRVTGTITIPVRRALHLP